MSAIINKKHRLKFYLERAGIYLNEKIVYKIIFNICIAINVIISAYFIYTFVTRSGFSILYIIFIMSMIWVLIFPIMLFIVWVLFYLFLDLRIYKRRLEIEEVLPDFLQLTASNMRAGMLIDKALWYAVRPRFGILAKEIEFVAKETTGGKDIKNALIQFSERYDSITLKRTISLILEGLNAGGDMCELINKIALNIDESRLLQKEMSANVSNYVIFIEFAAVVASPILFALGHQFLNIVQKLSANTSISQGTGQLGSLSFSGGNISSGTFIIFVMISLTITSFFSSLIIGTIKKGDARTSVKYIPIFIIITILLFYLADTLLGALLSKFF